MRLTLPLDFARNSCVCSGFRLFSSPHQYPHQSHQSGVMAAPRAAMVGSLAPDAENPVFPMPPAVYNTEITPITPAVKHCRCEAL